MSRGPGDGLGLGARVSQPLPARCRLRRSDFITWSRRAGRGFGWTALYVCSTGERGQLELNTPAPASGVTAWAGINSKCAGVAEFLRAHEGAQNHNNPGQMTLDLGK